MESGGECIPFRRIKKEFYVFLGDKLDLHKRVTVSLLGKAKPHLAVKPFKAQVEFLFNFCHRPRAGRNLFASPYSG